MQWIFSVLRVSRQHPNWVIVWVCMYVKPDISTYLCIHICAYFRKDWWLGRMLMCFYEMSVSVDEEVEFLQDVMSHTQDVWPAWITTMMERSLIMNVHDVLVDMLRMENVYMVGTYLIDWILSLQMKNKRASISHIFPEKCYIRVQCTTHPGMLVLIIT